MAVRILLRSGFLLAAAFGLMATAASAQQAPVKAASAAWSKSVAIIAGPSALQAVLKQQHAIRAVDEVAAGSFSPPQHTFAIASSQALDIGAIGGPPDVFGSVALKVAHTPLDAHWRLVEQARVTGEPARFADTLKSLSPLEELQQVNEYVNHRIQYEDDRQHFGRDDVWSSANQTLSSGRGDCEDYAIAKMQLLRAAGFPQHDLYLTIVHDVVRRADHAVLIARSAGHMFVLDDGTDVVLDSREVSDYRPVLTFASYGEWIHGYRTAAMVQVKKAGNQRSRSASLLALSTGFKR